MEKLTYRDKDGRARLTNYGAQMYCSTQATADCFAKLEEELSDYKEIGLEPEIIKNCILTQKLIDSGCTPVGIGIPLKHLFELAEAESNGNLIMPPCKVGDIMYYIKDGYFRPKEQCEVSEPCTVKEISVKNIRGKLHYGFILSNGSRYGFNSIGKTVFFSHEEAENAIKEN